MMRSDEHSARSSAYLDLLEYISHLLSEPYEPHEVFERIIDGIISGLAIQACWVQFFDADHEELRLIACQGFTEDTTEKIDLMKLGNDPVSKVALEGKPWVCADIVTTPHSGFIVANMPGIRSMAVIPLKYLDFILMKRRKAHTIAFGLFFTGKKADR